MDTLGTTQTRTETQVLLINPRLTQKLPKLSIPMGLMCIGSYIYSTGHEVLILDANNFKSTKEFYARLDKELPTIKCVGLSVMSAQIPDALKISDYIKSKSKAHITWGGVHPTLYPKQVISNLSIDSVVTGEGEEDYLRIVNSVISGTHLIRQIDPPLVNMNSLPKIRWELLDDIKVLGLKNIVGKTNFEGGLPLQTSRGCPNQCTFCINSILKNKWRPKRPSLVVSEIKTLISQGVDKIYFIDENFFANPRRISSLLDLFEKNRLVFSWFASARVDQLLKNPDPLTLLRRLWESGCTTLGIGAESGSNRTLKKLNKGITAEETLYLAAFLDEAMIGANFSFITGLPGESSLDRLDTLGLIKKIKDINPTFRIAGPQIYRPYPGSVLYRECLSSGMEEPKKLEDWANSPYIKDRITERDFTSHYPWIQGTWNSLNLLLNKVENLSFYTYILSIRIRPSLLQSVAKKIAEIRYRRSFYFFPIEKTIFNLIGKTNLVNLLRRN